jgi:hypothetical protein
MPFWVASGFGKTRPTLTGVAGREDLDRSQHAYVVSLARIEALFRTESKRFELPAPFGWRIAEPLDTDAAGQTTFDRCLDKAGREEGERDRHVDLPDAAFFADADFLDGGHSTGDDIVEPLAAFGDSADEACAALELFRLDIASRRIMGQQDPARSFGWWLLPGDRERSFI